MCFPDVINQRDIHHTMKKLEPSALPMLMHKIRQRVERFCIMPAGLISHRVLVRLRFLRGKIPPATLTCFLRALLNGWPTFRRMRTALNINLDPHCPFCQGGEGSIEHFPVCHVIRQHYCKFCVHTLDLESFLVLDKFSFPAYTILHVHLLNSVYLSRNSLVHDPTLTPISLLRHVANSLISPR